MTFWSKDTQPTDRGRGELKGTERVFFFQVYSQQKGTTAAKKKILKKLIWVCEGLRPSKYEEVGGISGRIWQRPLLVAFHTLCVLLAFLVNKRAEMDPLIINRSKSPLSTLQIKRLHYLSFPPEFEFLFEIETMNPSQVDDIVVCANRWVR